MSNLRPLNAKVILRLLPPDEVTDGGLIIPDNAKSRQQRGEVVAVGPGREYPNGTRIPPGVYPGQIVIFNKYAEERDIGGKYGSLGDDLVAVSQEEILAVEERVDIVPCFAQ